MEYLMGLPASVACAKLIAKQRWALSGTPIPNGLGGKFSNFYRNMPLTVCRGKALLEVPRHRHPRSRLRKKVRGTYGGSYQEIFNV